MKKLLLACVCVSWAVTCWAQTTALRPEQLAAGSYGTFGGAVNAYTMATTTPPISSNVDGYRVCGFFPSTLAGNTGAATFAAGTAPALPIRVKSATAGAIALAGKEILPGTNGNPICLQLSNNAAYWVMDSQAPGSVVINQAGMTSGNILQADWASQAYFLQNVAGATYNLPASATLSQQAGVAIVTTSPSPGTNVSTQLCATGSDTINGGAAAGCVTLPNNGVYPVALIGASFSVPIRVTTHVLATSWAPNMNLSGLTIPIGKCPTVASGCTITAINCALAPAVGGAGTVPIQVWFAASGTALGSGTHAENVACNANGTANSTQSMGIAAGSVGANNVLGLVIPTNANWASSAGSGNVQVEYTVQP